MGRQAVPARYRRTSGAHLHTHLTTLVICQFGRKIRVLLSPTFPGNDGSFDISRDVGMYVGFGVEEPLQSDAVHHGGE